MHLASNPCRHSTDLILNSYYRCASLSRNSWGSWKSLKLYCGIIHVAYTEWKNWDLIGHDTNKLQKLCYHHSHIYIMYVYIPWLLLYHAFRACLLLPFLRVIQVGPPGQAFHCVLADQRVLSPLGLPIYNTHTVITQLNISIHNKLAIPYSTILWLKYSLFNETAINFISLFRGQVHGYVVQGLGVCQKWKAGCLVNSW